MTLNLNDFDSPLVLLDLCHQIEGLGLAGQTLICTDSNSTDATLTPPASGLFSNPHGNPTKESEAFLEQADFVLEKSKVSNLLGFEQKNQIRQLQAAVRLWTKTSKETRRGTFDNDETAPDRYRLSFRHHQGEVTLDLGFMPTGLFEDHDPENWEIRLDLEGQVIGLLHEPSGAKKRKLQLSQLDPENPPLQRLLATLDEIKEDAHLKPGSELSPTETKTLTLLATNLRLLINRQDQKTFAD